MIIVVKPVNENIFKSGKSIKDGQQKLGLKEIVVVDKVDYRAVTSFSVLLLVSHVVHY